MNKNHQIVPFEEDAQRVRFVEERKETVSRYLFEYISPHNNARSSLWPRPDKPNRLRATTTIASHSSSAQPKNDDIKPS